MSRVESRSDLKTDIGDQGEVWKMNLLRSGHFARVGEIANTRAGPGSNPQREADMFYVG